MLTASRVCVEEVHSARQSYSVINFDIVPTVLRPPVTAGEIKGQYDN